MPIEEALDNRWEPNPRQYEFIQVPFDVDEGGYAGAVGAGKTDVLMLLTAIYRFYENPQYKGLFLRRTFPELEHEVIPRSMKYFPSLGGIYNVTRHRWEWKNGAKLIFGHLKDEKDVKNYDSGQYSLICWDEATSFTGTQYEYLTLRRNRSPVGSGLPAFTRWGSNPGNVGHLYFRKRFVDPYHFKKVAKGQIIRDSRTGIKRIFIPARLTDNPHLLRENPKYLQKLESITSEAERRAMIDGDWYTFEGQVFDEWRTFPMRGEPDNARHIIEPFAIPTWWPKLVAIDWGFSAWCFIIWAAISPDGRVYIYRTYAVKKVKIKEWTRDLALLSAGEISAIRDVRICWSAIQDQGHDQTIFEQVAESLAEAGFKCALTEGDRNRVAGKQLVHEYLRWKPLPKLAREIIGEYDTELAERISRMHGSEALGDYLKYFQEEAPERNLPKLQIFSKSPEGNSTELLTECIPSCIYDDKKIEDVKEFQGDDPYDCLRILLNACRDYFGMAQDEFSKNEKLSLISKQLHESGDQTDFYMQCAILENKQTENHSIRRRSGNRHFARGSRY